jgi:hypothetical protein
MTKLIPTVSFLLAILLAGCAQSVKFVEVEGVTTEACAKDGSGLKAGGILCSKPNEPILRVTNITHTPDSGDCFSAIEAVGQLDLKTRFSYHLAAVNTVQQTYEGYARYDLQVVWDENAEFSFPIASAFVYCDTLHGEVFRLIACTEQVLSNPVLRGVSDSTVLKAEAESSSPTSPPIATETLVRYGIPACIKAEPRPAPVVK